MPLTKLNQELHEDLDSHAACLDWMAGDLAEISRRIEGAGLGSDAKAMLEISKDLREWREIVITFCDEVEKGRIVRVEA